jgi:hypothetical protein
MKIGTIRTSVDLPKHLHERLHEAAAKKGCSAHELMLKAIEQALQPTLRKKGRVILDHGLVPRTGKPISITNEEIYELGFP